MSKKDNLPAGVRQEFDDIDYWHKLPKNKYVYVNGVKYSVYEWMKKAMHEMYANNFDRKQPENNILQTEEQKKWARRNNNNTNRDALNVIKKSGLIATMFHITEGDFKAEHEDWEKEFVIRGYEAGAMELMKKTCKELDIELTKVNIKLILRMYFRMQKFLRLVRKDKKNKKETK